MKKTKKVKKILARPAGQKTNKNNLLKTSRYNRALIEVGLDPRVTIGAGGKTQDVNKAAEKATGYKRKELVGKELKKYRDNLEELVKGRTAEFEKSEKNLALANETLKNEIEKFQSLFNNSEVGIYRSKLDGSGFIDINEKIANMFGYTKAELMAEPALMRWADPKDREKMLGDLKAKGIVTGYEAEVVKKSGEHRIFLSSIKIYAEKKYLEGTAIDITDRKTAEKRLKESELRFRQVFERSSAGKSLTSIEGKLLKINSAFAEMMGYTVEEIESINFASITHPDDVAQSREVIQSIVSGENETRRFEKRYIHKNGGLVWADVSTSLLRDETNAPLYLMTTILDITDRRTAEEALRKSEVKLRRFYESGIMGVIYWNMDGKILDANDKFLEMTGYTRAELEAGKIDWVNMTPPEFAAADAKSVKELKETGMNKMPFEKVYIRKDKSRLPIIIAGAMLDEARNDGVAIMVDITDRKQAEQGLENALLQLTRSNMELEQFAFVASHDLQEPLRAMTGYIQLLERKYSEKLDADAGGYIKAVVSGSARMKELINDLLAFSRIESEEKEYGEVDMNAVFDAVLYGMGKSVSESGAEITKDTLPKVVDNETHMAQLLQNLIGNAIKFHGREKPKIHVSARQEGNELLFSVKDNGIGVEKEYFEKIFVIFQRLHAREEYPGTGIGLAICKKIVERKGGRIWVTSEPGKGSTFYFTLPAAG